jgi:hypothetical protein
MAKVTIPEVNLNETAAWDGEQSTLPPGEFMFEVIDCTIKPPKKDGQSPQLEFDLEVLAGVDTDQCNGQSKKHWLSLAPKAAGRVRNMLDACGVAPDADGGFDSDDFKGKQFIAESYEETYDKPDLTTGETKPVINNRLRKERPVEAGWSGGGEVAQPEQPEQPAKPAATAPVKRAPAQAAPAAAATTASTTAAPTQPRVASSLPRRPPVPPTARR